VLLVYSILYLLERWLITALRAIVFLMLFTNGYIYCVYILICLTSISMVLLKMNNGYILTDLEMLRTLGSFLPNYRGLIVYSYWLIRSELIDFMKNNSVNKINLELSWLTIFLQKNYDIILIYKYEYCIGRLKWVGVLLYILYILYICYICIAILLR